jgi:hypothetical protein
VEFEGKEREKEEKIKNGEKIEEYQKELNSICFFYIKFFLDSLLPNTLTAFTTFNPEKYYLFPVYKQIQLSKILKNIYFNFGMFYFRYRPDIFDE